MVFGGNFGLEGIEACPCWLILDNKLGVPDPNSGLEDTLCFLSVPPNRSTNDLRDGSPWDGVFGVKSSARARLFVIMVVGIDEGIAVEGVRRDSRDGAFCGTSDLGVGVDAERIERP